MEHFPCNKEQKIVYNAKVRNELGLHARPATTIVKILQNVKSNVSFTHGGETINAKSLLSILMLAVTKNSKIKVVIEGDDAQDVYDKLHNAFENKFESGI